MKWWQRAISESVLVSSLIALMMIGTASYMWATGTEVPKELFALLGTIIGFFFGTKTGREGERIQRDLNGG